MDWFCYNLIILIKQFKIPYKNLDKALLFSRNQVFCLKVWKLWGAPTILQFNIFCWNFAHVFYLPISAKGVRYLFIYLLSYSQKIKKTIFSTHLVFTLFLKNSKSKQNKKNPTHHFADITKRKTCAKLK